jgi:hypothetical protein
MWRTNLERARDRAGDGSHRTRRGQQREQAHYSANARENLPCVRSDFHCALALQGWCVMARKTKGHAPPGKFAQIPVSKAKAVLADLSAPEFRVWFVLCLQCQHWANGTGKLCRSVLREHHLGSQRVVTSATKKLIERGHIVRTRQAKQRVCALYGVIHLPLNTDALAKEGFDDAQIRSALKVFAEVRLNGFSDSNSGSASSPTKLEALNSKNDNRGSAKPAGPGLVLPQGNRNGHFSTGLALPRGNTSKNLPSGYAFPTPDSGSDSPPNPLPGRGRSNSQFARSAS